MEDGNGAVVVARDVTRRYGEGETSVDALRGVSVDIDKERGAHRRDGAVGLREVHPHAHLRRPGQARLGSVEVAGKEITKLGDNELTKLRREHIGFVFQFFNLLPMLHAEENILLPFSISGEKPEDAWVDQVVGDVVSRTARAPTGGALGRTAAARCDRPRARPGRRCSSRTSRPATSTPRPVKRSSSSSAARSGIRTDDRHGHARPARCRRRSPHAIPRRRRIVREIGGATRTRSTTSWKRSRQRTSSTHDDVRHPRHLSRKLRTALTAIAIVLGVAMVCGTYVLTDSIRRRSTRSSRRRIGTPTRWSRANAPSQEAITGTP